MRVSGVFILVLFFSIALSAQNSTSSGVVKLRGTKLTYPLVNRWITAFNQEFPNIKVRIAQNAPADSIDLLLAAHSIVEEDLKGGKTYVAVSRYVQLPVVNDQNPQLKDLQSKGFRDQDFNSIYFSTSNKTVLGNSQSPVTVYNRERPTCSTITFARHFGNDAKNINGTPVKGDDQDLLNAVKTDVNGISFNNLGFIYNVETRKINPDIAVVPLDLNDNGKIDKEEQIYGSVDQVIIFVERTNNKKFIDEHVNVIFAKEIQNQAAGIFLQWVLTKGQKFNHEQGFLNLDVKTVDAQKEIINTTFKITSVSSCDGLDSVTAKRRQKLAAKR